MRNAKKNWKKAPKVQSVLGVQLRTPSNEIAFSVFWGFALPGALGGFSEEHGVWKCALPGRQRLFIFKVVLIFAHFSWGEGVVSEGEAQEAGAEAAERRRRRRKEEEEEEEEEQ